MGDKRISSAARLRLTRVRVGGIDDRLSGKTKPLRKISLKILRLSILDLK